MLLLTFIVCHWYASLFFQSFFHHRYAAHGLFTMSKAWEKAFHICCFVTQGSSYISAKTYGLMHRLHHAHTDTEHDPHSPHYTTNVFMLLWKTRNSYNDIYVGRTDIEQKYYKDLPEWDTFDKLVHNWQSRVLWAVVYVAIYVALATQWWMYLFLPLSLAMGALQGLAVNWWAHKFGYENFDTGNTSKNILPIDLLFVGEAYHNNHHKYPARANNAIRWFEFDATYFIIKIMNYLGVVKLKR
ncbi:acyl-CoA desaturase [Pedobacter sp. HMF7647]|uniref:Acyl-CoA desaturase n=1 Tax=Hufsiella arboris TaxID=2695275 RepID=A0A7K1Y598_9SPHI|nr:acyl-CoA desaturase [Hufsiella arboris]MXV49763.1 acyl-CoA desaturase [Hufsiella arboris]